MVDKQIINVEKMWIFYHEHKKCFGLKIVILVHSQQVKDIIKLSLDKAFISMK